MNTTIKTNHISAQINNTRINQKYDFFYLETCEKYIKRGAYILDAVALNNDVRAVKFESGKRMLVMLESSVENLKKLKAVISGIEDGAKYSIVPVRSEDIDDWILIQILLNALGVYDSDFLKFNNLTGHLYCYHEAWLKHGKEKEADVVWKIPALEVAVNKDMNLQLNVRTFSSEKLKHKMTFKKKKFEDYPKYVFSAKKTLRRKLASDEETCYIMRQVDGVKSDITFLDLQNIDKFSRTKMGVLNSVIKAFNSRYDGICRIEFASQVVSERVDYSKSVQKENNDRIKQVLKEKSIHIIDQISDEYSKIFTDNIKLLIEKKYEINASVGKRVNKDKLNIMIIHNEEYYDGVNDPHDKVYSDAAVQHITFEDFSDSSEFAISTVVHEMIIKRDIQESRISLFDWEKLGFEQAISFGMEVEIDDVKRYFFITINPDGSFKLKEQEMTLFEMNEYTEMVEIFEQARTESETVKGVIRFDDGCVNVIKDSGLFTIPEIDEISKLLECGDNKLRGKVRREELLSSCLDIKKYEAKDRCYYLVGTIGEGMRPNIQRASLIRSVEGYNGSEVIFDQMLPMMNVTFVHNGQLTVLPFPFKYLREYVRGII